MYHEFHISIQNTSEIKHQFAKLFLKGDMALFHQQSCNFHLPPIFLSTVVYTFKFHVPLDLVTYVPQPVLLYI